MIFAFSGEVSFHESKISTNFVKQFSVMYNVVLISLMQYVYDGTVGASELNMKNEEIITRHDNETNCITSTGVRSRQEPAEESAIEAELKSLDLDDNLSMSNSMGSSIVHFIR